MQSVPLTFEGVSNHIWLPQVQWWPLNLPRLPVIMMDQVIKSCWKKPTDLMVKLWMMRRWWTQKMCCFSLSNTWKKIKNFIMNPFCKRKQLGNGAYECQNWMNTDSEMWRCSVSIFLLLLQDAINLAQHYCSLRTTLWILRPASSSIWVNGTLGGYYTLLLHFTGSHHWL